MGRGRGVRDGWGEDATGSQGIHTFFFAGVLIRIGEEAAGVGCVFADVPEVLAPEEPFRTVMTTS
ncbi:MAG: hypothetical protein KJS67_01280 [Actinomycetales bacterium]|nr:hypothetical protein [Actinomycetales bacterium]